MAELREAVIEAEDELRGAVVAETGKTWEDSEEDHRLLVDALAFYADAVRRITSYNVCYTKLLRIGHHSGRPFSNSQRAPG